MSTVGLSRVRLFMVGYGNLIHFKKVNYSSKHIDELQVWHTQLTHLRQLNKHTQTNTHTHTLTHMFTNIIHTRYNNRYTHTH